MKKALKISLIWIGVCAVIFLSADPLMYILYVLLKFDPSSFIASSIAIVFWIILIVIGVNLTILVIRRDKEKKKQAELLLARQKDSIERLKTAVFLVPVDGMPNYGECPSCHQRNHLGRETCFGCGINLQPVFKEVDQPEQTIQNQQTIDKQSTENAISETPVNETDFCKSNHIEEEYKKILEQANRMSDKTINSMIDQSINELGIIQSHEQAELIQARLKAYREIQSQRN